MASASAADTTSSVKSSAESSSKKESSGPSPASSKTDMSAQILNILKDNTTAVDASKDKIEEIAEKRKALQAQRKKLTGELRNENRKRQRIRKRSQYLTDEDLVDVLAMRKNKKTQADAKGKASAKASAKKKPDGAA